MNTKNTTSRVMLIATVLMTMVYSVPAMAATYVVKNTNDNGLGSLRDAINRANTNPGADAINFNLAGTGPHTIAPLTVLPVITHTVRINGYTQPGSAYNTLAASDNARPMIELSGRNFRPAMVSHGLAITATTSLIRGLVINRFRAGIHISGRGDEGNNRVEGCFIGTDTSGTFSTANVSTQEGRQAVGVFISSSSKNTVGGTMASARNVISGNPRAGILIHGSTAGRAEANLVQGNFIGPDITGDSGLLTASGIPSRLPDQGIDIVRASRNKVGGTEGGASNVIAFNKRGVNIAEGGEATTSNAILGNSIFSNKIGIELNFDGVTNNDDGDADQGANNSQNFPSLTAATTDGSVVTIRGIHNSTPNTPFVVEFFENTECDLSRYGEGKTLIGRRVVMTRSTHKASFNLTFNFAVPAGHVITATATDPDGNTSEFSKCVPITTAPDSSALAMLVR